LTTVAWPILACDLYHLFVCMAGLGTEKVENEQNSIKGMRALIAITFHAPSMVWLTSSFSG
jgi:hypothetical protein